MKALINLDCGETTCGGCSKRDDDHCPVHSLRLLAIFDDLSEEIDDYERPPACLASTNQVITVGDLEGVIATLEDEAEKAEIIRSQQKDFESIKAIEATVVYNQNQGIATKLKQLIKGKE